MDDYLIKKRLEVLETIKPMCEAFRIRDYDYVITEDNNEMLSLYENYICCDCNSIRAVEMELVGYLFICYYREMCFPFKTQLTNYIKRYWRKWKVEVKENEKN